MNRQPLLFMLLGHPGSGKSYFCRRLAQRLNAVRFNGDAMRTAMFGDFEKAHEFSQREPLYPILFGALNYAVEQVLSSGTSVIYDAQHNQRYIREAMRDVAHTHNAEAIIIWVKTPYNIALERGQNRDVAPDQQKHSLEKMKHAIAKHQAALEEPTSDELLIIINGTVPFEQQYNNFKEQLSKIINSFAV